MGVSPPSLPPALLQPASYSDEPGKRGGLRECGCPPKARDADPCTIEESAESGGDRQLRPFLSLKTSGGGDMEPGGLHPGPLIPGSIDPWHAIVDL
ncbi:unnamed protein product [Arctogadus glacialis]